MTKRWEHCVTHHDDEATDFIARYFSTAGQRVLIVASAGFDPKSAKITEAIAATGVKRRGIFIREERPDADPNLRAQADENARRITALMPDSAVLHVDVFDPVDQAVVGGMRLARTIRPLITAGDLPTDIVIDVSALSIGMSFPLVRMFYELYGTQKSAPNLHLFVTEDPDQASQVLPEHAEQAMYVPGFGGAAALDEHSDAVRLWIPQLVKGRTEALRRIHDFVKASETCPILPFPARNLRCADELLEHFSTLLVSTWEVDPRSYIYAAERQPLDLYRSLLRLDDARRKVYEQHGGSLLVLSPIGSKLLAMGALLAALERDFPVAYLETLSYASPPSAPPNPAAHDWPIVHLWLSGVPYA